MKIEGSPTQRGSRSGILEKVLDPKLWGQQSYSTSCIVSGNFQETTPAVQRFGWSKVGEALDKRASWCTFLMKYVHPLSGKIQKFPSARLSSGLAFCAASIWAVCDKLVNATDIEQECFEENQRGEEDKGGKEVAARKNQFESARRKSSIQHPAYRRREKLSLIHI